MSSLTQARKQTLTVLRQYISGEFKPRNLLERFPDYGDDELLDSVINVFCEPLSDNGDMLSWNDVANVSISAIQEAWSVERFLRALEGE